MRLPQTEQACKAVALYRLVPQYFLQFNRPLLTSLDFGIIKQIFHIEKGGLAVLKLTDRIEMMTDRYLVESLENAAFKINPPERKEEVLHFTEAWEKSGSLGNTVFRHDDKVYLYYRGFPGDNANDEDTMQTTCLAISDDGINFKRAEINKIAYNGITENNIVFMGLEAHNFMPFYDENPDCSADAKFKAIGGLPSIGGLHAFKSADGITWERMSDKAVITKGQFDSMNTAFYDTVCGVYRCYSRYWLEGGYSGCRAIQSCTSTDFIHWNEPVPNVYIDKDEITEHYYTNATRPVPGAEHMLVSFPMRYVPERTKLDGYKSKGVSDAVFLSSRGAVNWSEPFKTAWIAPSLNERNWTQRNYITVSGIIENGEEFNLYVEERYMWDDCAIVRYSIPKYRFGSVWANSDGGQLLTKPFAFEGTGLFLNYATSAAGYISIAVLDEDGEVIPGFGFEEFGEIYGNELQKEVLWGGKSLAELSGKKTRLSITLNDAHLYALGKTD